MSTTLVLVQAGMFCHRHFFDIAIVICIVIVIIIVMVILTASTPFQLSAPSYDHHPHHLVIENAATKTKEKTKQKLKTTLRLRHNSCHYVIMIQIIAVL